MIERTRPMVAPAHEAAIASADYRRPRRTRVGGADRPRIVQLLASAATGGAQQSAVDLILRLDRRAFEVHTISLAAGPAVDRLTRLGLEVEVLDRAHALAGRLRDLEADLVHAHMFAAELAAADAVLQARTPVLVATIHSSRVRSSADQRAIVTRAAAFTRLIVPTRAIADKVMAEGRDSIPLAIIPNGITVVPRRPDRLGRVRAEFDIPADALLFGSVGRLEPEKGHVHLLSAWPAVAAAHPGAWLLIVGDGSLAPALRQQIGRLLLDARRRIVLSGARTDVAAITADLDVSVLPSLREAQGLVLLEAMSAGKPVVASRVGGIPEVVLPGRSGLLVPPADSAALASALIRLAADPALRRRLAEAGRRRVERHFTVEAMVAAVERVYRAELRRAGIVAHESPAPVARVGRPSGEVSPL